jgi:hypothetical protein
MTTTTKARNSREWNEPSVGINCRQDDGQGIWRPDEHQNPGAHLTGNIPYDDLWQDYW